MDSVSTALLVIDVQNAVCFGASPAFEADRVIERINLVSARARAAGAPVIVVQHESRDGELQHGSEGWRLAPGLAVAPTDIIIAKTASDAFHENALRSELDRRGVTRLIVCGFQSEFCVDSTTRRALALGYAVTLVSDGHSTSDNGILTAAQISAHHTAALAGLTSYRARVTPRLAAEVEV